MLMEKNWCINVSQHIITGPHIKVTTWINQCESKLTAAAGLCRHFTATCQAYEKCYFLILKNPADKWHSWLRRRWRSALWLSTSNQQKNINTVGNLIFKLLLEIVKLIWQIFVAVPRWGKCKNLKIIMVEKLILEDCSVHRQSFTHNPLHEYRI